MKSFLFILASFLLVTTTISSNGSKEPHAAFATVPAVSPVKAPPPPPLVLKPPPPPFLPKPPTTPAPPVKPPTYAPQPPPRTTTECIPPCLVRCKLHSRQNLCLRACVTCCDRCKCVPPGQYGNREVCGKCYTDMTTHGGRPKCP